MRAHTPDQKRVLAADLAQNDPEALEVIKTIAVAFGPLEWVEYPARNTEVKKPTRKKPARLCWWKWDDDKQEEIK